MRINSVRIQNFRSIRDISLNNLGEYVTVSGPNNTGKSNILRALNLLFNDLTDTGQTFFWQADIPQWFLETRKTSVIQVVMQLNYSDDRPVIEYLDNKFGVLTSSEKTPRRPEQLRVIIRSNFNKLDNRTDTTEWSGKSISGDDATEILNRIRKSLIFVYLPAHKEIVTVLKDNTTLLNRVIRDTWGGSSETQRLIAGLDQAKDKYDAALSEALNTIKEELLRDFANLDPGLSVSFNVPRGYLDLLPIEVFIRDTTALTDIKAKGTGLQNISAIILLYYLAKKEKLLGRRFKKSYIFGIEEPEVSLHVAYQRVFGELLAELSKTNQTFITTHSVYMLNHLDNNDNYLLGLKAREGHNETCILERRFIPEIYSSIMGEPISAFEGFEKIAKNSKIIITEGKHEYMYFTALKAGSRFKTVLDPGIEIKKGEGKDYLKRKLAYEILMSAGVKFLVVFDGDREEDVRPFFESIGLRENEHFLVLKPRRRRKELQNLEGIFSDATISKFSRHYQLEAAAKYPGEQETIYAIISHGQIYNPERFTAKVKKAFHEYILEHGSHTDLEPIYRIVAKINKHFED